MEWFKNLTVGEHVYLWIGVAATAFLIIQIIMMCFSSFGGDVDIDGDGDIDIDPDSGVAIFTVKSITAFFAVGCWTGLLTCALVPENIKWVSVFPALLAGGAAWAVVVLLLRAMMKLQCNGAMQTEKLIGCRATVYVSVPPERSGRGKITLTAQGRYLELDAMTDESEKIKCDEPVEIIATENECTIIRRASAPSSK